MKKEMEEAMWIATLPWKDRKLSKSLISMKKEVGKANLGATLPIEGRKLRRG